MTDRATAITRFLRDARWGGAVRLPLAGDASSRRYERLRLPDGRTAILMDAPPDTGQDIRPFVQIADHLRATGFSAPGICCSDEMQGFLLLEDFGDTVLADIVREDIQSASSLYGVAIDMLVRLRAATVPEGLTKFTPHHMAGMIDLVFDWYAAPMGKPVSQEERRAISAELESALRALDAFEPVLCLRDCHAENMIWLSDRKGIARIGLLDFQDAVAAHPAYDVVSLLQDARLDLPAALTTAMTDRYVAATEEDSLAFRRAMAVIGTQRHLRILGIFGRLSQSMNKPHYIDLVPRVWGHLQACLSHPSLAHLSDLVKAALPAPDPNGLERLKPHEPA